MVSKNRQMCSYFPVNLEKGIYLRPLELGDASAVFKTINSSRESLRGWLPWVDNTKSVDDSRSFLQRVMMERLQGTSLHLGIFQENTNEDVCLGVVGFREIRIFERSGVLGFWLSSEYEGRGLCTRACLKLIEYGQSFGLQKFEIHCDSSNVKSAAVARRLLFKKTEGLDSRDFPNSDSHVGYLLDVTANSYPTTYTFFAASAFCILIAIFVGSLAYAREGNEKLAPDTQGKHLLLVSGGYNFTNQRFYFDKAREMNIEISVADNPGHFSEYYATTNLIYSFHPVDLHAGEDELKTEIVNVLENSGIGFSGVLTFKDGYLVPVALAAAEVGLPTVNADVFRTIRNKASLRSKIGSKVAYARISSVHDIPTAVEHVGFPAVLKPVFGEGSLGVIRVSTIEGLNAAFHTITASLVPMKDVMGGVPDMLLESYIEGTEHELDIVVEKGQIIFASVSDDHPTVPPWFQETGRTTPSRLQHDKQMKAIEYFQNAISLAGLNDGVFHCEFIYTLDGPELVEINARVGGWLVPQSVEAVWGVDLVKIAYTIAAGAKLPVLPTSGVLGGNMPATVAIEKDPNVPATGYITSTGFMSKLKEDGAVSIARSMVRVGQHVIGPEDDRNMIFCLVMIIGNESVENLEKSAFDLINSIDWVSYISSTSPGSQNVAVNTPIIGMEDIYGLPRRKFLALSRILEEVAYAFGFDEVQVPLIERASTFSEDVVGQSPWPEWDSRGCFFFDVEDYAQGFREMRGKTPVVLVPEGTLSVARWLGHRIASNRSSLAFPLKIFYNMPCFRNEPIDSLSGRKKRQFDQFGVEILGTRHLGADAEIIWILGKMMEAIGIPKSSVIARVSNVQILIRLLKDSKIDHPDDIRIKEAMDEIAECRAKGASDCVEDNEAAFWEVIDKYKGIPEALLKAWRRMLHHSSGVINEDLRSDFPRDYATLFDELEEISTELLRQGVKVIADLCVVRSHEYYTHFSFEVDIVLRGKRYLEVAGGGRYDKLVGHFIHQHDKPINVVPSTGFAFGMQRILSMMEEVGLFGDSGVWKAAPKPLSLDDSTAEYLLVPDAGCADVRGYFHAQNWLEKSGLNRGKRVDTYVGDSFAGIFSSLASRDDRINDYQNKHKISKAYHPGGCKR